MADTSSMLALLRSFGAFELDDPIIAALSLQQRQYLLLNVKNNLPPAERLRIEALPYVQQRKLLYDHFQQQHRSGSVPKDIYPSIHPDQEFDASGVANVPTLIMHPKQHPPYCCEEPSPETKAQAILDAKRDPASTAAAIAELAFNSHSSDLAMWELEKRYGLCHQGLAKWMSSDMMLAATSPPTETLLGTIADLLCRQYSLKMLGGFRARIIDPNSAASHRDPTEFAVATYVLKSPYFLGIARSNASWLQQWVIDILEAMAGNVELCNMPHALDDIFRACEYVLLCLCGRWSAADLAAAKRHLVTIGHHLGLLTANDLPIPNATQHPKYAPFTCLMVWAGGESALSKGDAQSASERTLGQHWKSLQVSKAEQRWRSCAQCGKPAHFACAKCNAYRYCGKSCQQLHWALHKSRQCKWRKVETELPESAVTAAA